MGSYTTSPPNTLLDYIHSHWYYVKTRILAINAQRGFGGIVQARDWPFQMAIQSAFYMSVGKTTPSPRVTSWNGPLLTNAVRWCWSISGADLTQTEAAANRGDRLLQNQQMQTELLNGLFPGFCQKSSFAVQDNGQGQPQLVKTDYAISETVWWTKPTFMDPKADPKTGMLFGYATVNVSSFAPAISS